MAELSSQDLSQECPARKKCFYSGTCLQPSLHPTRSGFGLPGAAPTRRPHWGVCSPRTRWVFCSSHTPHAVTATTPPTHTHMLARLPHFMFSAALVHLTPGNVCVSCWLGTVTWGFFLKASFIISLMGPAFRLPIKRQLTG